MTMAGNTPVCEPIPKHRQFVLAFLSSGDAEQVRQPFNFRNDKICRLVGDGGEQDRADTGAACTFNIVTDRVADVHGVETTAEAAGAR